jgi:hypothetical protein
MKTFFKKQCLYFMALLVVFSACKKGGEAKSADSQVIVKYVITTSLPIATMRNNVPTDNWIVFAGNPGDGSPARTNIGGSQWSKEVSLEDVSSGRELGFTAQLYLAGINGTVNGKIYVNGALKTEATVPGYAAVYGVTTSEIKLIYILP